MRFDGPETEPYDRYQPKLHSRAAALVQEHVDAVLLANDRVSTIKSDAGFGKKVVRGVSGGDRLLHTVERPAFLAKNRFGLEESLELDGPTLASGIPYYAASANAETVRIQTHPLRQFPVESRSPAWPAAVRRRFSAVFEEDLLTGGCGMT